MNNTLKIIECPRDAMQGIKEIISTQQKANYINSLIKVGFDIIDFGSFVSPHHVPQMKDTSEVVELLNITNHTKLLAIVLNKKGALIASEFEQIKLLGYPLSISEIFQKKNSNKSIKESLVVIDQIQNICVKNKKHLLIYFSMAFGNPYDEYWSEEVLLKYIDKIKSKDISLISLADTIGNSNPDSIKKIYSNSIANFPDLDIGLHLHSGTKDIYKKIQSAWEAGCVRFDTAISGYGGCPFAQNKLIGNIPTESLLNFSANHRIKHNLDLLAFENAYNISKSIFV
tara:strand:- start:592 stop:1446 length:855 start_codon:yes stop_codon:yes gene_type:complete